MRLVSKLSGARARRGEGRPVMLEKQRKLNDTFSNRLRVPSGVKLTREVLGGVPVLRMSSGASARGTVLHLHGGGYALGSARQGLTVSSVCRNGGPDIVSVGYRLAPEHPQPAAVDDAIAVYRQLLSTVGPNRLVVSGESAGGGLLLLMLQRAQQEGLTMPAAAVAAFPWADLSMSGHSATANRGQDMLVHSDLVQEAAWFATGRDVRDPAVSPLFGSFHGFPRTYIPVGTHDLLLDDARRVAAAMAAAGVEVTLQEWPGAVHGFTALPLPEGGRYRKQLRAYVHVALPPFQASSLQERPVQP